MQINDWRDCNVTGTPEQLEQLWPIFCILGEGECVLTTHHDLCSQIRRSSELTRTEREEHKEIDNKTCFQTPVHTTKHQRDQVSFQESAQRQMLSCSVGSLEKGFVYECQGSGGDLLEQGGIWQHSAMLISQQGSGH